MPLPISNGESGSSARSKINTAFTELASAISAISGKSDTGHTHTSAAISDLSEAVDDRVAALLVAGSNVTLTYNAAAGTLTIASTGGAGVSDGDKGDISVSSGGAVWTVDNGLDAAKIADGTVSNAEFQQLNGVTSPLQTQIDGKVSTADATPVTARITSLLSTDDFLALRGGVPYLVSASVIADYTGGAPAATAPAAFTVGQWTATAGNTQIVVNITTLPSDGGSAITALEYRIDGGAAVAFSGTGTGSRTITGLTNDTAYAVEIRAVNAVGAGAWSDVKSRTPVASGSGTAVWESSVYSAAAMTQSPAAPVGLTSSDTMVFAIYDIRTADAYVAPAGWTLAASVHSDFFNGVGIDLWTAPGSTAIGSWTFTDGNCAVEVHRFSGVSTAPVRDVQTRSAHTWASGSGTPNMPSPPASASAGDAVLALYLGPQSAAAFGTPQAGYTRVSSNTAPSSHGSMVQSGVVAGSTGELSHNINQPWESRVSATLVLAAA